MSDFQIALIGIAVVVIIGVVVFNRIQERRFQKRAEKAFQAEHPDVLFHGEDAVKPARLEPSLGELPVPDDTMILSDVASPDALAPRQGHAGIHPDIDTVSLVLADAPIAFATLKPLIERTQHFAKPVTWEGLVGGIWEVLAPDTAGAHAEGFREVRVALQLADRGGPVTHDEIQQFHEMARQLATATSAVSQSEPAEQALARAAELDAFCADTDLEIAVNVTGKDGTTFAPTKVRGLAESAGMVQVPSGEYVLADDEGDVLFSLRNMDSSQPAGIGRGGAYLAALTFALDLPRVGDGNAVLERMFAQAQHFAASLGGQVVDDNRKPLTGHGVRIIENTLDEIAAKMIERGIAPGSPAARRLFS